VSANKVIEMPKGQQLVLASDFRLPLESVTQTFAILAKRGVGKTHTASVMAEELIKANLHTVIIDPIGVWWGLRASADGKTEGLPITILGGDHGDVPLEVTAGQLIADVIVDDHLSCILDLSLFRKGEQVRFMTDFSERLYHRNRDPLHLIIDEADAYAPQKPMGGEQRLLGAMEDLVRRGRARGLGMTLVTQRSAVLNKNLLTQVETLVALRTIAPQDRNEIDEWIKVHGTPEQRDEMMKSLPSLPIGTAWFWSPGWLDVFQRVAIRRRETFDSSATPKVGDRVIAPRKLAEVDLRMLNERIAATIERAKENNPAELRKKIHLLEQEIERFKGHVCKTERVEVPVTTPEAIEKLTALSRELTEDLQRVISILKEQFLSTLEEQVRLINSTRPTVTDRATFRGDAGKTHIAPRSKSQRPPSGIDRDRKEHTRRVTTAKLTSPQQRILDALLAFEDLGLRDVARSNVAVMSDQSPSSSGFTNNLGALRTAGLIEYPAPGRVTLTAAGRSLATPTMPIRNREELHRAWYSKLSAPKVRILQVLVGTYPDSVVKTDLAAASDQSPTSSGYTNNLGSLRSLGLIDYPSPGYAVATRLLFPEGLK
jgi:hypothetical protein